MKVTVTLTTIDPVLRVEDVCALLKISERQFLRVRPLLEQHNLLIEVLPRLDSCHRYQGAPFVRLFSDETQARLVRQELRELSAVK